MRQKLAGNKPNNSNDDEGSLKSTPSQRNEQYCAISTIVAVEDLELIEWSFEDMRKVMKSSRYIQEALTRAMTSAIVGKVVNFMVSRHTGAPQWRTLLDNWKHASHVEGAEETEEEEEEGLSQAIQKSPLSTSALGGLFRHQD